tara:strand:- start:1818 stop:2666 length:849 start_codon:yes stop_codon:yes gene_type:complete
MEQLKKYIQLNCKYIYIVPDYYEEMKEQYYESSLSVIYNNTNYSVKRIIKKDSDDLFKELLDELVKKIVFKIGQLHIKDSFNKDSFTILHRGNCRDFQENSIDGLEDACIKYDGFETDIRLTQDNYWVVNHDGDCLRIHQKDIILKKTSLVDILCKTNIPMFKKLLFTNKYNNKLINIEIKEKYDECNTISKISLINILLKFKNKVLVSSFDWNWFEYIDSYNIDFVHLILNINELPKAYNKLIIAKSDYHNIILKNSNLPIFGVYGSTKKFKHVILSIIDL